MMRVAWLDSVGEKPTNENRALGLYPWLMKHLVNRVEHATMSKKPACASTLLTYTH
jgi:hypothetical protein